jgi:GDP-L-fucose synthase
MDGRGVLSISLLDQRIVVTGGAGFLGRPVVAALRGAGVAEDRIIVPRRAAYDLTRAAEVERLFGEARPDVVIHLAAEVGGIGANRANPGRFFYANMAMGLHVVEQSRLAGVKKLVVVGTVCAYPAQTPAPFKEESLWEGYPEETNAAYGVAKRALLVMLQAYRSQYEFCGVYLLPTNLYGPGDNFDPRSSHVIPALIRKFVEAGRSGRVTLWGSGQASREFLYVEDCARGIVEAAARYDGAAPVNLGSGEEVTIAELAGRIQAMVGHAGPVEWDGSQPDGQMRRRLDTSRAKETFGFEARVRLEEGLRRTIEWYRGVVGARGGARSPSGRG